MKGSCVRGSMPLGSVERLFPGEDMTIYELLNELRTTCKQDAEVQISQSAIRVDGKSVSATNIEPK